MLRWIELNWTRSKVTEMGRKWDVEHSDEIGDACPSRSYQILRFRNIGGGPESSIPTQCRAACCSKLAEQIQRALL